MKKVIGAIFVALLVFSVLSLFSIGMSHYYFQTGLSSYYDVQDRDKWDNYSVNVAKSISCFEYALAFNRLGIFDKYYMYDIYYYLALSYWSIAENTKANQYLQQLLEVDLDTLDEKRRNELELLKIRTGISVNGIIDNGWRAIVNQNLVKEGDMINGVVIKNITPEYIEFQHKDFLFTDSVDRSNPLVIRGLMEVRQLIAKASVVGNSLALQKEVFESALQRTETILAEYALDKEDYIYLLNRRTEINRRLLDIEDALRLAHRNKDVNIGMTMDEVVSILGEADNVNVIIDESDNQKWEYPDRTLYFVSTVEGWILDSEILK